MMGSAIVGQPPNNQDDSDVISGLLRIMGIPDKVLDPAYGLPLPLKRPNNDHFPIDFHDQGPRIIAAMCTAITLVSLVTGARLGLRFFRKDLHWGWEDFIILPAAVCIQNLSITTVLIAIYLQLGVIAWLSLVIAMVRYGGAGKHIYDNTYMEINWFTRVGFLQHHSIRWLKYL